jgi:putative ABC transport system permease protein
MFSDLRFSVRTLLKAPGFAVAVILIAAVGIGAVTTMFSVLRGVVLQPLPFRDPGKLVWVDAITDTGSANSLSALDYFDYRDKCDAFESLAARSIWQPGRIVLGRGEPERVTSGKVSGNYFHTLGVRMAVGRSFIAEEEIAGSRNVVVVSHRFWQAKLGGAPDVVGQTLEIDGADYEIVGVTPADFDFPSGVEMWFPMQRGGGEESGRGNNNFVVIGRLADGVDLRRAQSQIAVVAAHIATDNPKDKGGWSVALTPLHEKLFGGMRPTMLLLMGATVVLLLIACANLSSLFLARTLARRGEMAVRLSLGASPAAVAQQLSTESSIVIGIGAAAGISFAYLGLKLIKAIGPSDIPRLEAVHIDGSVLLGTVLAAAVAAGASSVFPAWRASRWDLMNSLHRASRSVSGGGGLGGRRVLVAAQMALSLVLLVITGLLLQSAMRLQRVSPGFEPAGLLTMSVQLPASSGAAPATLLRFQGIMERLRALPGVVNVASSDQLPPSGGPWNGVYRADRPSQSPSDLIPATRRMVTPGFFPTLHIPIETGRDFTAADVPGGPPVTIISQALAQRLFPAENPVGRILMLPWGDSGIRLEIVGVAGDVRDFGLAADVRPAFYLASGQIGDEGTARQLVLRTNGDPSALFPSARASIRGFEKDATLWGVATMTDRLSQSTARNRFSAALNGMFAAMAAILAAFGLYGLMSFLVGQRTREIGIRIALGAQLRNILCLVIGQGMLLALAGVAVGVTAALGAARLIEGQLYEISPVDVPTFLSAVLVLAAAALAACWLPARRATKVDPIVALRSE